jgi:hypothetical protein
MALKRRKFPPSYATLKGEKTWSHPQVEQAFPPLALLGGGLEKNQERKTLDGAL